MATGVGRGRICLTSFSSPTPKTPYKAQKSGRYLLHIPSYSRFCLKIRCHGNGVGRGRICLTSFNPTPKPPYWAQQSRRYLLHKPSYSRFCLKIRCHGNSGHPGVNLNDAVQLSICHFLLLSHWNRVSIFSRFRDIRPPKPVRAHKK